ncbi:MAG: C40 family peptidase [Bacteroidales bacterium]|nr:C40 family peptidase [Bacteroidales bacterium]
MKQRTILLLTCCIAILNACGIARQNAMSPNERLARRTGQDLPQRETPAPKPVEEKIEKPSAPVSDPPTVPETTSLKGRELVRYAKEFQGTPYRYAGNGPDHFDCSGFTTYVFKHFGVSLPRTSQDQFSVGKPVRKTEEIQPGDLVFFARGSRIFHVGIAVESRGDHFTFIHASTSNGVILSDSKETYWVSKYYGAKRILH